MLSKFAGLCLFAAALFSPGATASAAPGEGALGRTSYEVFVGDVNGDGREDILMKARPRIVSIPLDDDLTIPLAIPPAVSSFVKYWKGSCRRGNHKDRKWRENENGYCCG